MYVFKSKTKRVLAQVFDAVGGVFFRRAKKTLPPAPRRILVIRIDHLGDIVLAEPFLAGIKRRRPNSKIVFLTTAGGAALFLPLAGEYDIVTFDAAWFSKRPVFSECARDFLKLKRLIQSLDCDAVFDLRGDARHIVAARAARPGSWIGGYGTTGGGFLLDWQAVHEPRSHAVENNLRLLESASPERAEAAPLSRHIGAGEAGEAAARILEKKEGKWVALHAGAGSPAKEWPLSYWTSLTEKMATFENCRFFWIGDAAAGASARRITETIKIPEGRFTDLCGKLPLSGLGTFLKKCDVLLSSDSGPVHVAAAQGVPTVVLFSGTNEVHGWKPLNDQAYLMYHEVPCAPCHRRVCPKPRHYCMEGIYPDDVFNQMKKILK